MKFTIAIQTEQFIETEEETAEAAIEKVKSQMDPRIAAAAAFQVLTELQYDDATLAYVTPVETQENL